MDSWAAPIQRIAGLNRHTQKQIDNLATRIKMDRCAAQTQMDNWSNKHILYTQIQIYSGLHRYRWIVGFNRYIYADSD
jgi:hypothetical protein